MTIVIRGARVIDGTGGAAIADGVVVVAEGRVVGVFAGAPPEGLVGEGAEILSEWDHPARPDRHPCASEPAG